jgi:hypothetical protein
MYEAKTRPTDAKVADYLNAIADESRRADCTALVAMMEQVTGKPATMWGTGIVGFGQYHYTYASGHEGDWCLIGFAARKHDISIHLLAGYADERSKALLARLGRHKTGKACLYVKRLADVDRGVLMELMTHSVAAVKRMYP